jgi:hypothetical protein
MASYGQLEMVQLLVSSGAHINAKNVRILFKLFFDQMNELNKFI